MPRILPPDRLDAILAVILVIGISILAEPPPAPRRLAAVC
jgi:hypothetical protein